MITLQARAPPWLSVLAAASVLTGILVAATQGATFAAALAVVVGALGPVGSYALIARFQVRPEISVRPSQIVIGEPAVLSWRLVGRLFPVHRLRIDVVGAEVLQEDDSEKRRVFHEAYVMDERDITHVTGGGQVALLIPEWAPPLARSKLVWTLEVRGYVRWLPDLVQVGTLDVRSRE